MGNSETKNNKIVEDKELLDTNQLKTNIDVLPGDVIRLLASKLLYIDIAYLCRTSNNFNRKICNSQDFHISYGLTHLTSNKDNLPMQNGKYAVIRELAKLYTLEHEKCLNVYDNLLSRIEYLEYIVDNNYDIYIKNKKWNQIDKNRLLIIAAEVNDLDLVKYLIDKDAKTNIKLDPEIKELYPEITISKDMEKNLEKYLVNGYPALKIAARRGNLSIIKYLLSISEDRNIIAFDSAIEGGNLETIKYLRSLLDNQYTNLDQSAISTALRNNYMDVFDYFINRANNMPTEWLFSAAQSGNLNMVKNLIEQYGYPRARFNCVSAAAKSGNLELVKYLIGLGADPHFDNDYTVVEAARYGQLEILKYLKSLGCKLNSHNNAAIFEAVEYGHLDVVKYLIENGATTNNCLFVMAAINGRLVIFKYLISKGADISCLEQIRAKPNIVQYLEYLKSDRDN